MMHVSERGLALIRQYEGFSATPYLCPAGKNTIGYGHVILTGEVYADGCISENQANDILKQDVRSVEVALNNLLKVEILQNQFDALGAFTYNIGANAFEKSSLLAFLNAGDYDKAAAQFGRWVYGGGKILSGLQSRRGAEMALFLEKSIVTV